MGSIRFQRWQSCCGPRMCPGNITMKSRIRKHIACGTRYRDSNRFKRTLALRVPHKLIDSNKIDWFITEQYSPQCNILEALEPA